jgi:hypothetical protein
MGLPSTDEIQEWEKQQALEAVQSRYGKKGEANIQDVIGDLQQEALKHARTAFDVIVAELDNPKANPASRMKAAERILEIIGGKKMETLHIQDEKSDPTKTMENMFNQLKNGG